LYYCETLVFKHINQVYNIFQLQPHLNFHTLHLN